MTRPPKSRSDACRREHPAEVFLILLFVFGIILGLLGGIAAGLLYHRLQEKQNPEALEGEAKKFSGQAPSYSQPSAQFQADAPACVVDEQLIQAHKLAAFGQLSTGVAHEINNPLAIINEEAGWMQDLLNKEESRDFKFADDFRDSLGIIIQQTRRCGDVTRNLLSFAENMESNIREVDLNGVIEEVVGIMEKEAQLNNIVIARDLDQDLPRILSDSSHLRQLFLNLINNALDAVERDGQVVISTRKAGEDKISIAVTDNGCGIHRNHLHRVFDPFFTTKPPGKGTGLGLSICYGIVNKLGGSIAVESAVARGSTFTVTLPLTPPADLMADFAVTPD